MYNSYLTPFYSSCLAQAYSQPGRLQAGLGLGRTRQSKLTISTQFEPLPVGYLPIGFKAPLAGSIA